MWGQQAQAALTGFNGAGITVRSTVANVVPTSTSWKAMLGFACGLISAHCSAVGMA